ncbi:MAG TPA: PLP-dependent aminotransferase family protein [Candidatus Dormibacteraeota bacterium]
MNAATGQVIPLVQFIDRPGVIDLAWGHPDPTLLPVEGLKNAAARAFDHYGADAVNYGYAAGPAPLIEWLGQRLAVIDAKGALPEELLISGGTSQALDQVATLFTRAGDIVLVESPTYHLAVRILQDHPLELIAVPTDQHGIDVAAVEGVLRGLRGANRRVAFFYTIPTYQNPTTSTLPIERRRKLVDLAASDGLLLVEDDAYRELAYDGPPPPSLWALSQPGTVIRLGSFAKSLAPGLRSGFITADPATIGRIRDSGLLDSGGGISHFSSLVIAEFAATGEYERNVETLRNAYRQRREALLATLTEKLGDRAGWQTPHGGYFVWITLPDGTSIERLGQAALREGTSFMPASAFYLDKAAAPSAIRLSFSRYSPDELIEAATRLAKAIDST